MQTGLPKLGNTLVCIDGKAYYMYVIDMADKTSFQRVNKSAIVLCNYIGRKSLQWNSNNISFTG
jgi:hypothetical protein